MKANLPFKHIITVKNGKQYVVFDYRDGEGKRKRKWVTTGLPEKCAKKALNDKVEEIVAEFYENYLNGNVTKTDKPTSNIPQVKVSANAGDLANMLFGDYVYYWYNTAKSTFSYNSVIEYEHFARRIREYFDEKYPGLKLNEVTGLHIQQYYNDLHESGRKYSTVRSYHAYLHSAFKYAVKMDILLGNPTEKAQLPRKEKREPTFYTKDELEKLLDVFKGDRLELVINIAAFYGLRRGEIIGLNWDSIDFENKTMTIRRKITGSYKNGIGEYLHIDNELKTESSVRTLPLIPRIEKMLRERKELEEYYSELLGDDFDRTYDGFVCRDNTGKLITPYYASSHFRIVIRNAGLKHIRFHDLRHSCASLMVANGVPMKVVQEWLPPPRTPLPSRYQCSKSPKRVR
ncbi:Site-specific recombinase XerD [Ruminococcus sp. YE71]|uniref:tyrosine-type recombinase/integrase n=1 Tax=unclassified Ruminococcus TaxID=2608920 RepID=UPI00088ED7F6|nr:MULTISPECIES: site-specific integrase [unclassified Ruminococcus]SDA28942.1 Site-specific recombinase XerD [Ruminococcus sp. YE78]SFW47233.1 Site-specific recombinase XerD [Ruminococcus sp. YE71]